ncbi:MAG: hypothetical protein EDR02_15330 [Actinobacteria bacterium]|nr:MAG: hypothetical protein EDR02_15330 [Actinomycetota bacterium]
MSELLPNAVMIDPADNVATLLTSVAAGDFIACEEGREVLARGAIAEGHKVALTDIAEGEAVYKYGHPIGHAGCDIATGEHVHIHNLARDDSGFDEGED